MDIKVSQVYELMPPVIPGDIRWVFFATVLVTLIVAATLMARLKAPLWGVLCMPIWAVVSIGVAKSGYLIDGATIKPLFMLIPAIPIGLMAYLINSGRLDHGLESIHPTWLVLPQANRIVIEWVLAGLAMAQIIPTRMSYHGSNFDVLSGIAGLVLGLIMLVKPLPVRYTILYNYAGLLLLLNIVVTAILSAPLPIQVFTEPPVNSMVAFMPMILLPAVLVPFAATLHLLGLRKVKLIPDQE